MSGPKRILLIDHEPRLTAMVSSALRASGQYLIQEESYSPNALQTALHFQPDLILVDAEPEHLEIDQVAGQIHAERALHDVPLVCLTSLAPNGQIGTVGFLGGYTFLANPLQIDDMVSCIAEILKKKGSRRPLG
jgi:DNA-binding response OmpR family regulator